LRKLYDAADRFCARHPRFGVPDLMRYIVIGNVVVFFLIMLTRGTNANALNFLYFDPQMVLRGEVWRIVTYIFVPSTTSVFWLVVELYFYYWIGSTLEREWGTARFNLYYWSGVLLTVIGALLAKEVVRRVPTVDYPLLIASAYSGFVIWHAGLSGSIPLDLVAGKDFGGVMYQAPITETVFHPVNLIMCGVILVLMPFINYAMHPDRERAVTIDPTLLVEDEDKTYEINTPAEKLEHSKILWGILCLAFLVYIIYYFITNGFTLGLNIVNMIFMFLGILLHGDLRRYVDAVAEAAGSASGVLLQFPFYAGIMGMMVVQNEAGVSLAGVISQFFVNISNNVTFPMLSFLAAGIVNFFVPSGGGQWAVQGPIMMPAGAELGIGAGRTAMATSGPT